jgi:short-subunit dehydrogenase
LITGASSGIGLELARLFAADGSDLVLVARRREVLEDVARTLAAEHGVSARVLAEDLSDAGAPRRVFAALAGAPVDVLVNNAGFGARGTVAGLELDRQMRMIQVNVTALTELTRLFLPAMLERRRGGVLNVASTAAFQPGPHMAVYYATKAYVLSFTEALAEELRGTGVRACCLAPGATRTGFEDAADMKSSLLFRAGVADARAVARAGHRGLRRGKVLVVPGLLNRLGAASVGLAPRAVARKLAGALNRGA